jgi:hypothetical protein
VQVPDLTVVAEGDAPAGQRWYLKVGGSADNYYTLLETVHPDGRRDESGMGGPLLYPVGLEYTIATVTCFFSQQGGAVMRRSGTRG